MSDSDEILSRLAALEEKVSQLEARKSSTPRGKVGKPSLLTWPEYSGTNPETGQPWTHDEARKHRQKVQATIKREKIAKALALLEQAESEPEDAAEDGESESDVTDPPPVRRRGTFGQPAQPTQVAAIDEAV